MKIKIYEDELYPFYFPFEAYDQNLKDGVVDIPDEKWEAFKKFNTEFDIWQDYFENLYECAS